MTTPCRTWWQNCALKADSEILAIDRMEDRIAPIATDASEIRGLISTLELCHHKADRWVANIIEAIGVGKTGKGLGTRSPGQQHPAESVWQNACVALSAWVEGCPPPDRSIGVLRPSGRNTCQRTPSNICHGSHKLHLRITRA